MEEQSIAFQLGFNRGMSLAAAHPKYCSDGTPWDFNKWIKFCVPNPKEYIEGVRVGWVAYQLNAR